MKTLVAATAIAMTAALGCRSSSAGSGGAPAARCSDTWEVVFGGQEADDAACSAFTGSSSEVKPEYDWWAGQFHWRKAQSPNLRIEVQFSRPLGDRSSPAGIHFRGGFFDVATDSGVVVYYFWEGDDRVGVQPAVQHWTNWVKTKVDVTQETTVAVRQKGVELEGFINGALVGTFKLNAEPPVGPIGVGFKTPKGKTDQKVSFRGFTVTDL